MNGTAPQWTFEAEETSDGMAFSVYDEGGHRLTEPGIGEVQARLMAASPEMLSVLQDWLLVGNDMAQRRAIRERARAAISKATAEHKGEGL